MMPSIPIFTPKAAIKLLAQDSLPLSFMRPWLLAQLLAWALLDQSAGRRSKDRDPIADDSSKSQNRRARRAGQVFLIAWILKHEKAFHPSASQSDRDEVTKAFKLFIKLGGFKTIVEYGGVGGGALIGRVFKSSAIKEFQCVLAMVDYFCKCRAINRLDLIRFDRAAHFYNQKTKNYSYSKSAIEKAWNKLKSSSPVLYAAYHIFEIEKHESTINNIVAPRKGADGSHRRPKVMSIYKVIDTLPHASLQSLLSMAADVSDVLSATALQVYNKNDFAGISRTKRQLSAFTEEELTIINRYAIGWSDKLDN